MTFYNIKLFILFRVNPLEQHWTFYKKVWGGFAPKLLLNLDFEVELNPDHLTVSGRVITQYASSKLGSSLFSVGS